MKILQVVPFFSPVHGGSAIAPYHLSRELARRGHDVTIFTSDYKLSQEWVKSLHQVKVYPFKTRFSWAKFYITPNIIKNAKEEVRCFDIIHMHNYRSFQNFSVHYYANKYSVPYVLQAHGSLPRIMAKQRLKLIHDKFFGYRLLRHASKVIAVSATEVQQYKAVGVPEEKIEVIPNVIDLSEFADLPSIGSFRKKFSLDDNEKIVLYLGRIHQTKGLDILFKAFASLAEKIEHVRLAIVGPDDGYLSELKVSAKALNIEDDVLLVGPLYGKEKCEAYVDADVYVLPSKYEIWGITALESVACGTPVILTENCGVADYLKNKVGLVVKHDTDDLREALLEMLLNDHKRSVFKKNCKALVEDFDASKIVPKLERIYEQMVDSSRLSVQNNGY
ncbi:MAG: glycosyltransferase [Candidatus Bathyarchaeota archaeon]|nr:glycosyltransferase [Candidatus Bathyarchaeota archaeon]